METEVRPSEPEETEKPLRPENQRMLEFLREWRKTPLTPEEIQVLDQFEEFRRQHPFSLHSLTPEE